MGGLREGRGCRGRVKERVVQGRGGDAEVGVRRGWWLSRVGV